MDKLAAHNPVITHESFIDTVPPLAVPSHSKNGKTVLKPDLELFHKTSTAPKTESEAQAYAASQYEIGLAEGERKAADLHAATIAVMQDSLTRLQENFTSRLAEIKVQNADAVTHIFEAVLPALSRHSFTSDFQNILGKLIDADIADTVHITCAQSDVDDIRRLITACPNPELFELKAKHSTPQHISLNWKNGGGIIDYSRAIDAANTLLSDHFSPHLKTKN